MTSSLLDHYSHYLRCSHSSSKKCDHLNHLHHHHSEFVNKSLLFQHPHHSFSVNDHHNHQLSKAHKLLFAVWELCQSHHDQSSSNDFHPSHPNHVCVSHISWTKYSPNGFFFLQVTSSSNDGSHTEVKLNEKPLFNVLLQVNNMLLHATSSSNTKQFKFVLFVNFNVLVLLKKTLNHISNDMVHNSLMLLLLFNKLVLLVSSKIS